MKKTHLLSLAIAACLAFGAVWVFVRAQQEPEFEGRKLSEWLSLIDIPVQRWTNPLVKEAIQTIGPDALPHLLKSISDQSSHWYRLKLEIAKRLRYFRNYQQTAHIQQEQTMAAFELLGHRAEPALPELRNLLSREETARLASRAIQNIGTEKAVLELATASTNHNLTCQFSVLQSLRNMGSAAKPAMPILTHALEEDRNLLDFFIHSMEQIDINQTITVLERLATNSEPQIQMKANIYLMRLAPANTKPGFDSN